MFMLEVKYDLKRGYYDPIPEDTHLLTLQHISRLTSAEKALLKSTIIRNKLDISLMESVVSSSQYSHYVIQQLEQFQKERKNQTPNILQMVLGWLIILLMFALPIGMAYHFSDWLQSHYVEHCITFLGSFEYFQNGIMQHIFFGDYGVLSLGTYSFVWALPVVVLISLSSAIVEQSHLKDWITWAIEPTMIRIGLNGEDIIPLLEGFGCNAAAITQAGHQCHACTKTQCMSLISFGSSCSYQIGATLSIFSVAGHSWLFIPYLILVLVGGIIHNRLWMRTNHHPFAIQTVKKSTIHLPSGRQLSQQIWNNICMFVIQAMPIFITICFIVSIISLTPVLSLISHIFMPILMYLGIPNELSPGILFSMIRKDGMLLFNMHQGAYIQQLSVIQLLLLVFLSSTYTACFVTMTMVFKQLGLNEGFKMIVKQMVTSLSMVIIIATIVKLITVMN